MLTALYNRYHLAYKRYHLSRLDKRITTLQHAIDSDPAIARHYDLERRISEIVLQLTTNDQVKNADYELWETTNARLFREKAVLQEHQQLLSAEQRELVSRLQRLRFERWLKADTGEAGEEAGWGA